MKKIIITLAAVCALYSCEDATDIVQPSEFNSDRAFQSADDVKTAVFGVYGSANSTTALSFTANFTDESSLGSAGNNGSAAHRLILNVNDGFAQGIWANNYNAILRANILFDGATRVTPALPEDIATYNEALGEAYALRAYAYSKLISYFGVDMSDRSSAGVILIDFIPDVDTRLPRSTVGEVMDFINRDLDEAQRLLTAAGTAYSSTFVSLQFVDALRARINAYAGNYSVASAAANRVLNTFSLSDTANEMNYRDVWQDIAGTGTSNEVIFKFNNTLENGNGIGSIFNTNRSSFDGAPLLEVSRPLYNLLEEREATFGDIRRPVFIDPTSVEVADYPNDPLPQFNDRIVIDKYPGDPALPGLTGGLTNDQKVFRTAEMHFILAEAAVAGGNLDNAEDQIEEILEARYTMGSTSVSYNSATEAWAGIVQERFIELAWEGHRYVDLKRLGGLANQGIDRNDTDCSLYPTPECDLSPSDFRLQALPIPQAEFQGNPNVVQNPGY
ncbi:MAG: RagB/SusD family nutrient uptake outer membrane protein [Nonlabens sp.]